ncbi:hypothetical protein DUNSADRAFT_14685 [Dunaliella salina]|uniref:Encoded protein n=1 Tax=Dunaliella salina TaxID=3046 RepID=A0ABQ7G6X0_DUNSA|nr:hypothetical protein DUNSADRAFT_14685 [Dunaliella salina]|eukprot:KAF5830358.1 hypothetical protein DUNSADRAFT_14685 [Dunaliella salina]
MADLGFGEVELLKTGNMEQEKLTVSQTGSRRTLQSYTFRKAATNQEKTPGPSSLCLSTAPGFDGTRYLQEPTTTQSGRELAQLPPPRARCSCRSPAEQQQQQQQQQQEQRQGRERSRSSTRAGRG